MVVIFVWTVKSGRLVRASHLGSKDEGSILESTYDLCASLALRFVTHALSKFSAGEIPIHLPLTRALRCQGITTVRPAASNK